MAFSTVRILLLACACAFAWALPAHAAPPKSATLPIVFTAQSTEIDYKNGLTSFRKVQITQGNMAITADQGQVKGTGVNFQDTHWTFRDSVKITVDQGVLNSDDAQVFFANNELVRATATGKPATFQQKLAKADKIVNGHADNIDYDAGQGIVHLITDAWLSDGQDEIRHDSLKYNLNTQSLIADPSEQQGQRVHIIITPKSQAPAAPKPAAPAPAAPTPAPPTP